MKPRRSFRSSLSHSAAAALGAISTIVFCATVTKSTGAEIWTNPITGTNPGLSNPYTTGQTFNANITVSGIGMGAGIAGNTANNRYNANSWNTASLDPTAYFTFTLDANPGYEIDFTSFVYTGQASATGPTSFAFSSSLDGFASTIGSPTATGTTIDLSAAAYQNLISPIEFRFYAWGASASTGTFSINDFTFNGTVVPEPTSALAGLLLGAGLLRRRRRCA